MVSGKCELDIDLSNYSSFQSVVSGKYKPDIDLSNYNGLQLVISRKCELDTDTIITKVCSQWYLGNVNQTRSVQ